MADRALPEPCDFTSHHPVSIQKEIKCEAAGDTMLLTITAILTYGSLCGQRLSWLTSLVRASWRHYRAHTVPGCLVPAPLIGKRGRTSELPPIYSRSQCCQDQINLDEAKKR